MAEDERESEGWRGWPRFGDGGGGERMFSAREARWGAVVEMAGGWCEEEVVVVDEEAELAAAVLESGLMVGMLGVVVAGGAGEGVMAGAGGVGGGASAIVVER